MEDIPPSYDNINPEVLDLLPPYLNTPSLVNLCLVSRKYYVTFIPHLWGSPASHFVQLADNIHSAALKTDPVNLQISGAQNDMVYVALTRFKRILRRARLSTRLLCHTFHLPPALSEIYGGPNATWLREVLDWLPALQSLSVSGLPFFDHHSLVAVARTRQASCPPTPDQYDSQSYPVKLLLATREPNVTSIGLSLFLPHLPRLVYLDLSYTTPARDMNVLSSISALEDLQILKLRGIQLRDHEVEVLANAIGLRVRLLDLSENMLTDMGLRSLLQACFMLQSSSEPQQNGIHIRQHANSLPTNGTYSRNQFESWPVGIPPPTEHLSLDTIRTVDLDQALMKQLTNPLTGRLAFEDIPHGGITHLYISGNPGITIEGIRSVLDLGKIHVLDAAGIGVLTAVDLQVISARRNNYRVRGMSVKKSGSVVSRDIRGFIHKHRSPPSSMKSNETPTSLDELDDDHDVFNPLHYPGAEKLVPVLQEKASSNLTYLRIEHKLVTAVLDMAKEKRMKDKKIANKQELPGSEPLAAEVKGETRFAVEAPGSKQFPTEVSAEPQAFEMDSTPAFRAELPGDMIHFAISPPVNGAPKEDNEVNVLSPIRADGAYAPEVVSGQNKDNEDEDVVLDATGSGIRRRPTDSTVSSESTRSSGNSIVPPSPLNITKSIPTPSTDQRVVPRLERLSQIQELTKLRPKPPFAKLHPSFLPNLRTLVLTDIPSTVEAANVATINNLKDFIAACAAEARLALLKAQTNYSLPPGRARQDAEREHAQTLFALRTIVLEISPLSDKNQQRDWKHTRQRLNISKSSTGDHDSEAMWSAAENDFSFFGEEGEEHDECGIYDHEQDKYYPTIPFDDKIAVANDNHFTPISPSLDNDVFGARAAASGGSLLSPISPIMRNNTVLQSPRNLPLGRNRRTSNESQRTSPMLQNSSNQRSIPRSIPTEVMGSLPSPQISSPVLVPRAPAVEESPPLDVVAEIAKWRRERKAAHEEERRRQMRLNASLGRVIDKLADAETYVEGYWTGEIKVVRTAKPKSQGKHERAGNVDVYGNYYEGGYLYP